MMVTIDTNELILEQSQAQEQQEQAQKQEQQEQKQQNIEKLYKTIKVSGTAIYLFCALLMLGAVLTFVNQSLLHRDILSNMLHYKAIVQFLDRVIQRSALVSIIETAGISVSAMAVAWLVGVTGQFVCGVRVSQLITWVCPGAYAYYFAIFLPTVFLGVYLGEADVRRLPTFLAALGVVVGTAFVGSLCYLFVFSFRQQESIGYAYHKEQLKIVCKTEEESLQRIQQTVQLLAKVTADLDKEGKDIHAFELTSVLKTAYETYEDAYKKLNNKHISESLQNKSMVCYSLAERFWDSLLTEKELQGQSLKLVEQVLGSEEKLDSWEKTDLQCQICGLLLTLRHKYTDFTYGCDLLLRMIVTSYEYDLSPVSAYGISCLGWGFLLTFLIDYIMDPIPFQKNKPLARELLRCLSPIAEKELDEEHKHELNAFLMDFEELFTHIQGCSNDMSSGAVIYPELRNTYFHKNYEETVDKDDKLDMIRKIVND